MRFLRNDTLIEKKCQDMRIMMRFSEMSIEDGEHHNVTTMLIQTTALRSRANNPAHGPPVPP
jgi:hypothetical protein